ncbi:hypothetical protein [Agromyces arachidis]|uniref:hypothetical protein n=1 Tax=Agromyces arachidis TaxID=766966 RepID=UPI0040565C18
MADSRKLPVARASRWQATVIAVVVALGLAGCGDRWIEVDAADLVGEWSASVDGNMIWASIRPDGTVRFTDLPERVFCAGADHRISEADWSNSADVAATWELDAEYQDPGSLPLGFRDNGGCWANAYVVEQSGAMMIKMLVGPPTDGSTVLPFRRSE